MELQQLWEASNQQLEEARLLNMQSWALQLQSRQALQLYKAKSKLNRLIRFKQWAIALGILWVVFLCYLIFVRISWQGIFFNISAGAIAVITSIAIGTYIKHIELIRQVDNSDSIVEAQQTLAKLQASSIRIVGIIWLQLPFYSMFYLSPALLQKAGTTFAVVHTGIVAVFVLAAIWLYRNTDIKNRHKRWFKLFFSGLEFTSVSKAIAYLDEVEEWKKDV